jgi:CelD/BcsL family acetyltransferase involved in cellulose biosynthesis
VRAILNFMSTRFDIHVDRNADAFLKRLDACQQLTAATAFQTRHWLGTWYHTIGARIGEPVLIAVIDRDSRALVAALPLVRRVDGRLRLIEFADYGVSDYNCPILGAGAPSNPADARALWTQIESALPASDLIRFTKMPAEIEGQLNPFALLPLTRRSTLSSNVVTIDKAWADYLKSLERTFRKELGRSWRVFANHQDAAFRRIEEPAEAARVLGLLEQQQRARLRERGASLGLDRPEYAEFYRSLIASGIAGGNIILTALMCRDELVSALLGVARGDTYVMVRISSDTAEWSNCSPGRLVIVKTMEMLHVQGYQHFDFSIGDYAYKRRLGVRPRPLHDLLVARSVRGIPLVAFERVKRVFRRSATARSIARHLHGRLHNRDDRSARSREHD